MQRWQCPIDNGTLETVSDLNAFVEKPQLKIISFQNYKHFYLMNTWSDNALKGTVVNQTLPSLHGDALDCFLFSA